MKTLIITSMLLASTAAFSAQDKCYELAKRAAFGLVKDGDITTIEEFSNEYGNEEVEVVVKNGWQKEYWSFYNTSSIINVEIDALKNQCVLKKLDLSQNDQD